MGFDGIFLHKLIDELLILKTGRITKINEISTNTYTFIIRANSKNYTLYLNFNSDTSRIHITNMTYNHILASKPFTLFLKKNLEGFFIRDIYQYETDRIIVFTLDGFSEMRDKVTYYLICEVMGRFSNLILTTNNYEIIDCLHKDGVSEFNRIIMPHVKYEFPKSEKLNPYKVFNLKEVLSNLNSPKDLVNTFLGVSYSFANMVFKDELIDSNFMNLLNNYFKPSTYLNINNKEDYYYYSYNPLKTYDNISELLDDLFFQKDKDDQIRKETSDILKFVNRQLNKLETKLNKLADEKRLALDADKYKLYGELLLQSHNLKDKLKNIEVYDYYNDKNIIINLDNKLTILENSQKYYKKYQKLKKSIAFIDEQTKLTLDEIEYFNNLKVQIFNASLNDVLEIMQELEKYKYIRNNTKKQPKKKQKPNILTYETADKALIYVGKNNIQNEYVTFTLGKPNYLWFHVKDGSGSHVLLKSKELPTENDIRCAANLASLYSFAKDSSSVQVDYTLCKFVKKIPGKKGCMVNYKNQKTIYIDPDKNIEKSLKLIK